ncbi:hypothetical protein ACJOMJ_03600, partial [Mycoplasmopsis synoviae]
MWFTSGSVTKAKEAKDDTEYSKVTDTLRTDLEAKLTAAISLLEDGSKLANLDVDGTLATTQASLESAKTALDAAVDAVKPDLDFQKTKTSAAAKVTELESLVNTALKAELQRQVNELTKEQADQATTILENLTSLKESLESLQTLVSDGLKMQVDYQQKYYDADNKEAFDAALLKASSVFPAFQWTAQSIIVETPEGQLPNPRAWTKAREKSEFVLQNFVMAPAQAAPTTAPTESGSGDGSRGGTSAAASATVRLANGEAASREAQTTPDLASTVSYIKTLDTDLKAQTAALNGDTTTNKTAYYKPVNGRTLYWDGFMPKITLENFTASQTNVEDNKSKLQTWFNTKANWSNLEDQLVKKLGSEKFKNVKLTNPQVDLDIVNSNQYRPKVTFDVTQKEGYELQSGSEFSQSLTMVIRVLYTTQSPNANVLQMQGASSSAAPGNTKKPNDPKVIKNVNVYPNYTGPSIVLDEALPTVGGQENTLINGTSNVDGAFNNAFRGNPSSGLLFTNRYVNPLLQSVINYVNKFDPKYRATFVTNLTNGVTITKVEKNKKQKDREELRPGTLNDLNKNNVFLQQIKGDTEAVYFAATAVASNNWLNAFLIRIPLTKFVKPLSVFTAPVVTPPTQNDSQEDSSNAGNTNENTETPVKDQTAPTADLASTASYLKSLNDTLKAATDALNGDNPTTKTAYYKADAGRTLYWDGFMLKIVVQGYQADGYVADGQGNNRAAHEDANKTKLQEWFETNQDKLSLVPEQLTKKLGEEKFKNMVLSTPTITWDEVRFSKGNVTKLYLTPKVTFNLAAKEGYGKATDSLEKVTLTIRNLYKAADPNTNLFATQGASSSAAPKNTKTPNDDAVIKNVNVYLNYTGPNIELDQAVPAVGTAANTSLNGTSDVTDKDFNTKFKKLLVSVFSNGNAQSSLLQAIINYVNKFDPKFRAVFVTKTNGVAITKVQNTKELRPGTLDDLVKNERDNVFLQQIQGDTEAVYFAVTAIASNNWLNTVLVRIPLTKFVRSISVLEEQSAQDQTPEAS